MGIETLILREAPMIDINQVRSDPVLAKVVQAEFRRAVGMTPAAYRRSVQS